MSLALCGLGSNVGDRAQQLHTALVELRGHPRVHSVRASQFLETAPVGDNAEAAPFLNAAALLETDLGPTELLHRFQDLERRAHRVRESYWSPRSLDVDLLLYDDVVLETEELVLPHRWLPCRWFVLAPASEVAPEMRHPVYGRTIAELLEHLQTAPNYIAVTGSPAVGKTEFVKQAAVREGAAFVADPIINAELHQRYSRGEPSDVTCNQWILQQRKNVLIKESTIANILHDGGLQNGGVAISDFWFDQTQAYNEFEQYLASDSYLQFTTEFIQARSEVIQPKVVLFLDAPNDVLLQRVRNRNLPFEQHIDANFLNALRTHFSTIAKNERQPPFIRVQVSDNATTQIQGVLQGMKLARR